MRLKLIVIFFVVCWNLSESKSMDYDSSPGENIEIHETSILINSIQNIMSQIKENAQKKGIKVNFEFVKNIYEDIYQEVSVVTNIIADRIKKQNDIKNICFLLDDLFKNKIKYIENTYNIKNSEKSLLLILLETIPGYKKTWSYLACYYLKQGYDSALMIQLLESRPDISASHKLKIFEEMGRQGKQKKFLQSYIIGLMSKGEFQGGEISKAVSFLQYNDLTVDDWLVMIDVMFTRPVFYSDMNHFQQSKEEEEEEEKYVISMFQLFRTNTKIKRDQERLKGDFSLSSETLLNIGKYKDAKRMLSFPAVRNQLRDILRNMNRPFMTDMSIIQHLSQRFVNESYIRDYLMECWGAFVDHAHSPFSMDQLGTLTQQSLKTRNFPLARRLLNRINFFPKRPKQSRAINNPTITFVASQEPSGDGKTPGTLDYFMGSQYPWLSLVTPELLRRNYTVEVLSWEDPTINWQRRPFLFIGPVWGYSKKQVQFDEWLARMRDLRIPLINSMKFITWNFMKTYLVELQENNISVVPSLAISEDSPFSFSEILDQTQSLWGTTDIILKGLVGAGGFDYHHYKIGQESKAQEHLEAIMANNRGAIIQPFWREISEKGELSFVFEGNALSHSYLKVCAPKSELVQVFYGGKSFHLSKEDLSYQSKVFFDKLRLFRPDIKITENDLTTAHVKVYELWYDLKKFFEIKNIVAPPIVRLDCVIKEENLYLMEIEGLDPYLELGEAAQHDSQKNIIKWYANEIIRQHSIHHVKPVREINHENGINCLFDGIFSQFNINNMRSWKE